MIARALLMAAVMIACALSGCVAVRVVNVNVYHEVDVQAHDNAVSAEVAP